jgi:hypothetical protein
MAISALIALLLGRCRDTRTGRAVMDRLNARNRTGGTPMKNTKRY